MFWVVNYYVYIYSIIKTLTNMKVQLNIGPLVLALVSGFVALNILNGNALNYVKFAAVENELGCAVIALTMCVLSLFVTFEKITDK